MNREMQRRLKAGEWPFNTEVRHPDRRMQCLPSTPFDKLRTPETSTSAPSRFAPLFLFVLRQRRRVRSHWQTIGRHILAGLAVGLIAATGSAIWAWIMVTTVWKLLR